MKHLIIVAHPVPTSFTMGLARAYAAELEHLGNDVQMRDLYRMRFDPVLTAHELTPADADHPPDTDVVAAQDDVRAAAVLTMIYPLWWLSMPAMMKGYVDRVFARGFAYEANQGVVHGLFSGKKCVLVTISGAPLSVLTENGRWDALQVLQDTHIFRSAGFELLEHLHFDAIVPHLADPVVERHLARIRSCARTHFSSASVATAQPTCRTALT
jgi:NAD(P)H dehydrogenase (quinone)